jgi:hypothetical protein
MQDTSKRHPLFLGGFYCGQAFFLISPVLFLRSDFQGEASANGSANIS